MQLINLLMANFNFNWIIQMDKQKVWVPDIQKGFLLGRVVDLGAEAITVLPVDKGLKEVRCPYERVYPAEDDDNKDVDDNCKCSKSL